MEFQVLLGAAAGFFLFLLLRWTFRQSGSVPYFQPSEPIIALSVTFLMAGFFFLNERLFVSSWPLLMAQLMTFLLLAAALYDLFFRLIPIVLLFALVSLALLFPLLWSVPLPPFDAGVGAAVVGGVVLLLYIVTKGRGIGEADIFLGAVIGALFGWIKGLLVFSVANFLGLVVMIPFIAVLGKARTKLIPLVSFLVLAIFLEWHVGYTEEILKLVVGRY